MQPQPFSQPRAKTAQPKSKKIFFAKTRATPRAGREENKEMSARATPGPQSGKRGPDAPEANGAPPAKRLTSSAAISMTSLQRELQTQIERRCRLEESVEQLRVELQLMGRLLAAAREQFVACGAPQAQPGVALWTAPKPSAWPSRAGRSKTDAKLVQRLQDELAESKAHCRRLSQQVESQQQKTQLAAAVKKELLAVVGEMHDYVLHAHRT